MYTPNEPYVPAAVKTTVDVSYAATGEPNAMNVRTRVELVVFASGTRAPRVTMGTSPWW